MLLADLTAGEWIAVAGVSLPLACGFIYWMATVAMNIGKILQKLDSVQSVQVAHEGALDSHDDRLQSLDLRMTKLETAR